MKRIGMIAPSLAAAQAQELQADPCDAHMVENLGWLQQYIEIGFFTDYRNQAWHYYATNETSYAFLWLNSISYANLDFLREACPAAAALALLLRAEERLPAREADLPLLELALQVEPSGLWPLKEGLERLRRLVRRMALPEEYTVDVVMPYCNEPLDGLLSKKTGYEEDWLAGPAPLRHARLILYRLTDCFSARYALRNEEALDSLPESAKVAARLFAQVEVVPVDQSPKAWESARYFLHMYRNYDDLADFTLVLHPDVFEHVNPRTLRNMLQSLRVGTFRLAGNGDTWHQHLSLSHHYLFRPSRARFASANCTDAELGFQDLWQQLFNETPPEEEERSNFGFYCCSQFLVHRDLVRARHRGWYLHAQQQISWEHCATSYMELLWHGIFRGVLHERKRQDRPELPLFLRVDNFLEGTSDGLI
ncbi:unnamed protein product [Effrenium voratum]|uniref:Uncharacterized protein n=1 Tax=Effrenium voratum TaxID=2562239 RepID=A0AA36HMJ5_9DINO|nr:unnamed protein product [Effrenium voratum]CAJ1453262.1 unnamed protein product [Effrenium voratum]